MATASFVRALARAAWLDLQQVVRYGSAAPRWAQRIWIDPRRCTRATADLDRGRRMSGQVHGGQWTLVPVETIAKVRMAEEHWRTGASWEAVGAVDHAVANLARDGDRDGVHTLEDVRRRFRYLDGVFDQVRREGWLRTRAELPGRSIREHGGVYMHVGADGAPVFGNGGCHRLAMARVLDLVEIPAQLGALHPDALPTWRRLRSPSHA
jgi:hypothetical protein